MGKLYPYYIGYEMKKIYFSPSAVMSDKEIEMELMNQYDRLIEFARDYGFIDAVLDNRRNQERIRRELALL